MSHGAGGMRAWAESARSLNVEDLRGWAKSAKARRLVFILVAGWLVLAVGGVSLAWVWSTNGGDSGENAETPYDDDPDDEDWSDEVDYQVEPALAPPTIDIASERLTLNGGKVDITGYAPGAVRAYLYVNGRELALCDVVEHGFSFDAVPLGWGRNAIEVKVSDMAGAEASSMATIIERMSDHSANVTLAKALNRMRGPREFPHLALTIDAGASSRRAKQILDVLKDKGIITTFFLTGRFIENNPEIVQRIVAEGHEVGNHTYSHLHLTTFEINGRNQTRSTASRDRLQHELTKTKQLFEDLTGVEMAPWWRAPYGEHNRAILGWAEGAGFKHVDWTRSPRNMDILDWVSDKRSGLYRDGDSLYKRLVGIDGGKPGAAKGGIILIHLGSDRKDEFLDEVLPKAIDRLEAKGYKFVTISRMFKGK